MKTPTHLELWFGLFVAVLLAVSVFVVGRMQPMGDAIHEKVTNQHELKSTQDRLVQTEEKRQVLEDRVDVLNKESTKSQHQAEHLLTTLTFDAITGNLTQEVIEEGRVSDALETTVIQDVYKTKTAVTDLVLQTEQSHILQEEITKSVHELVKTPGRSETGFSVGVLATAAGVGPAVGWKLLDFGPVHARAIAGGIVHGAGIPSPRAGLAVGGTVLPSIDLGVGLVLAPAGAEPFAYPVFGFAGVAPAITLQYRF